MLEINKMKNILPLFPPHLTKIILLRVFKLIRTVINYTHRNHIDHPWVQYYHFRLFNTIQHFKPGYGHIMVLNMPPVMVERFQLIK